MTTTALDTDLIIAAVVHDVKNSLGMITTEIEQISNTIDDQFPQAATQLQQISLEASRINNGLMHLLGLYRSSRGTLHIQIDEVMVQDLLEDATIRFSSSLSRMGIEMIVDFDDIDLAWYLDRSLVEGILNNAITNAIRYTKTKLTLTAREVDGFIEFVLTDDGEGYPDDLLNCLSEDGDLDFRSGSTGLGLHFSDQIARQHINGDKTGYVSLTNDPVTQGAIFKLVLPWI